jgi:hypothetical protein
MRISTRLCTVWRRLQFDQWFDDMHVMPSGKWHTI